jgi:hypothetical protein
VIVIVEACLLRGFERRAFESCVGVRFVVVLERDRYWQVRRGRIGRSSRMKHREIWEAVKETSLHGTSMERRAGQKNFRDALWLWGEQYLVAMIVWPSVVKGHEIGLNGRPRFSCIVESPNCDIVALKESWQATMGGGRVAVVLLSTNEVRGVPSRVRRPALRTRLGFVFLKSIHNSTMAVIK